MTGRRWRRLLLVGALTGLLLLSGASLPVAQAWNAAGHRQIAALAWETMTPRARETASRLLDQHPDVKRWRSRQRESFRGGEAYGVFVEASTWADEIRNDSRFYDEGKRRTRRLPGFPSMARHQDWHYQDVDGGKLAARLRWLGEQLDARQSSRHTVAARAYALVWLLHLAGDAHQPLHVGWWPDRGGNLVTVVVPRDTGREARMSLHRYWDDLPGPPRLRGPALASSLAVLRTFPLPEDERPGDIGRWLSESRTMTSARVVYPDGEAMRLQGGGKRPAVWQRMEGASRLALSRRMTKSLTQEFFLSPVFQREAEITARQQVARAGKRLGAWLNVLLDP